MENEYKERKEEYFKAWKEENDVDKASKIMEIITNKHYHSFIKDIDSYSKYIGDE